MENLAKGLIGLAVLAFVGAVFIDLSGMLRIITSAEALSRASNNLSLVAIALLMLNKK